MLLNAEMLYLIEEQSNLIRTIAEMSARLLEVTTKINSSGGVLPSPAKDESKVEPEKKPMPKHFGPDPNYVPPVPTPESKTLESHVLEWDSITKM